MPSYQQKQGLAYPSNSVMGDQIESLDIERTSGLHLGFTLYAHHASWTDLLRRKEFTFFRLRIRSAQPK